MKAQGAGTDVTTPKYSHQNVFSHISLSSQPFLMVQGLKLMGLCVGPRGIAHVTYKLVATR